MAQYPTIRAGQRLTGALLQSMIPIIVRKTATTARASTTTVADDPDLTCALSANGIYYVEFFIKYATPGATGVAGFKTQWNVPSGASGTRTAVGEGDTQNDSNANNVSGRFGVHGFTTAVGYGSRSTSTTNQLLAVETAVVTMSSTAGNCTLQWAQQTSNGSNTSVFGDSIMRVTQLA